MLFKKDDTRTMEKTTNGELNRPTPQEYKDIEKKPIIAVLDNIRSANNVGSFFRTADAFGLRGLVLCGITAAPPSKDIHKTALGAELTVEWSYVESTVQAVASLRDQGYIIVAVEQIKGAVMLQDFEIMQDKSYALVFGNEVMGVDQAVVDVSDMAVEIPQYGTKHSLNVAVSGGVVLWEFSQKF